MNGGGMFGYSQDDDNNNQPIGTQPVNPGLLGIDNDDTSIAGTPVVPKTGSSSLPVTPTPAMSQTSSTSVSSITDNNSVGQSVPTTNPTPTVDTDTSLTSSFTTPNITTTPALSSNDDLANIKRQALQELSPLIEHLDQNADEKFKTTMMMIQASDDKNLIPQAFKAAKEIPDEKKRAQALLDIVNEINYFTHKTEE